MVGQSVHCTNQDELSGSAHNCLISVKVETLCNIIKHRVFFCNFEN